MNKIRRINNGNYIDTLLSKKCFLLRLTNCQPLTTYSMASHVKYCILGRDTGYLSKDISFIDIVYFEPKNIQYKKLVNGVIDRLKVSLTDGDGNGVSNNFKISIVLHVI